MTREQLLLQRKLKINGKPVKVVAGQAILPNFEKKEEDTQEEKNEDLHANSL